MKIMVSACLAGADCKYNGGNNRCEAVLRLAEEHELIPVCPEVFGGLPTPRVPSEIRNGRVVNREGADVDMAFRVGAEIALGIALREKPDVIVLMSRSPSCGVKERYDGTFTGTLVPGMGVFAELAQRSGFTVIDAEDLEEWLTKRM